MLPVLSSNLAQRVLSQATNIGYTFRDGWRIETAIDDDRKTDYFFRHFYATFLMPVLYEWSFRIVENYYSLPMMGKALKLDKLAEMYKGANNFKSLHEIEPLRRRLVGSLVKADNHYTVPALFEAEDLPKLAKENPALAKKAQPLVNHLKRLMNYDLYIEDVLLKEKKITAAQAAKLREALKSVPGDFIDKIVEKVDKAAKGPGVPGKQVYDKEIYKGIEELSKTFEKTGNSALGKKLTAYIKEGLESKHLLHTLKKIQGKSFWPKMLVTVVLNFIFYGTIISYLDVNMVQPWQEQKIKEGINPGKLTRGPAYLAMIPGAAVVTALMSDKIGEKLGLGFMKKLGYVSRFAVAGWAAFAAYSAAWYAMIKYNEKRAPRDYRRPAPPAVQIPQGFKEAPLHKPNRFNTFAGS